LRLPGGRPRPNLLPASKGRPFHLDIVLMVGTDGGSAVIGVGVGGASLWALRLGVRVARAEVSVNLLDAVRQRRAGAGRRQERAEHDDEEGLIEVVREMRHKGTSILVASQDPPSVPTALIELSSQVILHKFNSPAWLRHIQKANSALNNLTPEKLSSLGAGEAYLWSSKSTDTSFSNGAVRIRCRPRVTQHGGATRTAL
jgi:hypothetical protein